MNTYTIVQQYGSVANVRAGVKLAHPILIAEVEAERIVDAIRIASKLYNIPAIYLHGEGGGVQCESNCELSRLGIDAPVCDILTIAYNCNYGIVQMIEGRRLVLITQRDNPFNFGGFYCWLQDTILRVNISMLRLAR